MQRDIVIVVGQTGCGKTTWARGMVKTLSRCLILDASFGEFDAVTYPDFPSLVAAVDGKSFFRAAYTPRQFEIPSMFDLARVLGRCHLVIEEADRLDDPRVFPEYDEAISRGRHYGVSLTGISLYPAKLPAMLRRQATRVIAFRQIEPRDIDYLAEIIGPAADDLPDLAPFHYVDWSPVGGAKIKKLVGSNATLGKSQENDGTSARDNERGRDPIDDRQHAGDAGVADREKEPTSEK